MEPLQQKKEEATSAPLQNPTPEINHTVASNPDGTEIPQPQAPQMRTFSVDLADELRKHQGAAMKNAIMENERKSKEQEVLSSNPRKNSLFAFAGVFLVIVAICVAVGVFLYQKKINTPIPIEKPTVPVSIIKSEDLKIVNITGKNANEVMYAIKNAAKESTTQTGMIDNLYVTQGTSTRETRLPSSLFLSTIGAHVTPEFSGALNQDYMLGIYSYVQPNLFIIFRGTQHDFLLTGMLQWEPYMTGDLAPLFGIDTSGNSASLLNTPYTETMIENHDTRAIIDVNKKPVLFYSFLDENTIIITNDAKTLTEAVRRLSL